MNMGNLSISFLNFMTRVVSDITAITVLQIHHNIVTITSEIYDTFLCFSDAD